MCAYNASRTPLEDKLRLVTKRLVYREGVGDNVEMAGSNWETVWVLRQVMGLPPLDKFHRTGIKCV